MKKITNDRAFSRRLAKGRFQQGLVLEIVLIVLIAIFLAAIGLYRSVDTSTGVAGNLAFKRDAENRAQVALDEALTWLENDTNYQTKIIDGDNEPAQNFSARMLETDAKGIPVILTGNVTAFDSNSNYTKTATDQMDSDGMRVRYVIERMCTRVGPMTTVSVYCSVAEGVGNVKIGGTQPGDPIGAKSFRPLLRVSIRVDGPRDTVAYVQAMIDP